MVKFEVFYKIKGNNFTRTFIDEAEYRNFIKNQQNIGIAEFTKVLKDGNEVQIPQIKLNYKPQKW